MARRPPAPCGGSIRAAGQRQAERRRGDAAVAAYVRRRGGGAAARRRGGGSVRAAARTVAGGAAARRALPAERATASAGRAGCFQSRAGCRKRRRSRRRPDRGPWSEERGSRHAALMPGRRRGGVVQQNGARSARATRTAPAAARAAGGRRRPRVQPGGAARGLRSELARGPRRTGSCRGRAPERGGAAWAGSGRQVPRAWAAEVPPLTRKRSCCTACARARTPVRLCVVLGGPRFRVVRVVAATEWRLSESARLDRAVAAAGRRKAGRPVLPGSFGPPGLVPIREARCRPPPSQPLRERCRGRRRARVRGRGPPQLLVM
jgi:hypothetical protein